MPQLLGRRKEWALFSSKTTMRAVHSGSGEIVMSTGTGSIMYSLLLEFQKEKSLNTYIRVSIAFLKSGSGTGWQTTKDCESGILNEKRRLLTRHPSQPSEWTESA